MLIRRDPVLLCLTSTELTTAPFELSSKFSKYDVHIMPPQEGDIPNEVNIVAADGGNVLTMLWADKLNRYRFNNRDERMHNQIPNGVYKISADKPGSIIYMTPGNIVGFPDYGDAIHLMANAIIDLENRIDRLETFMEESSGRFEQIESDIVE